MSGAAFEGLEDVIRPEDSASYAPGSQGFDRSLVEEVAEFYLSGKLDAVYQSMGRAESSYSLCISVLGSLIGEADTARFNPSLFIDEVLEAVAATGREFFEPNWLLTPLLMVFYKRGFNDFRVTMPEGLCSNKPLAWLKGTEENPLRVRYAAGSRGKDYISLGWRAQHCHVTTTARADDIGTGAVSSVFAADCEALYGSDARACEFHIHSRRFRLPIHQSQCTYYAHVVSKKPNLRSRLDDAFFWRGNRMLYPGGNGAWREVRRT